MRFPAFVTDAVGLQPDPPRLGARRGAADATRCGEPDGAAASVGGPAGGQREGGGGLRVRYDGAVGGADGIEHARGLLGEVEEHALLPLGLGNLLERLVSGGFGRGFRYVSTTHVVVVSMDIPSLQRIQIVESSCAKSCICCLLIIIAVVVVVVVFCRLMLVT